MSHGPPNGPYYYPGAPGPPPAGGYTYVPTPVMMPVYAQPTHHPPPPQNPPPAHYPHPQQYSSPPPPEPPQPTYVTNYIYQQPPPPEPTPPPPPPTVTIIEAPQTPAIKPWQAIAGIAEEFLSGVNKVIGSNQETSQTIHVYHGAEAIVDWVPATTSSAPTLTHRAFVGGKEGWDSSPLWVIRAHHSGEFIPGKLSVKQRAAYIPHGGREVPVHNFEVLCAPQNSLRWVPASNGQVPVGAIPAGNTHNGEPLYIGRCKHMRSTTPGKIHPSHGTAYISYGGSEITYRNYEVLCKIVG